MHFLLVLIAMRGEAFGLVLAALLVLPLVSGCLGGDTGGGGSRADDAASHEGDANESTSNSSESNARSPGVGTQVRIQTDLIWHVGPTQLYWVRAPNGTTEAVDLQDELPSAITGVAWGDARTLYLASHNTSSIVAVDPRQGTVEEVTAGAPLSKPVALDVLEDGRLIVYDTGETERVGDAAWAETPRVLAVDPASGQAEVVTSDPRFTGPRSVDWGGIAAAGGGVAFLLTANSDTRVLTPQNAEDDQGQGGLWRVDVASGSHELVATHADWVFASGVEILEDGRLFVADYDATDPGTFVVEPSPGEVELVTQIPNASLLWGGERLPDGRLVVSDICGDLEEAAPDDCGPGGLWVVDPANGDADLLAETPGGAFSGQARVVP